MLRKLITIINKWILNLEGKQLELTIEKSDIYREADIDQMIQLWKLYQNSGKTKYNQFMNACIFSSIVGRDIQFLTKSYILTKNKNEKNLYGRLLSMTIIEFLEDINKLLGNKLRKELIRNELSEYVSELNNINKEFSRIKKENNKPLSRIRNNAAAHKTLDSKALLDFTSKLEIEDLNGISNSVSRTNKKFVELSIELLNRFTEESKKELDKLNEMKNAI